MSETKKYSYGKKTIEWREKGERKSIGDIYDDLLFTTETDLVQKYYNLLILDVISFQ